MSRRNNGPSDSYGSHTGFSQYDPNHRTQPQEEFIDDRNRGYPGDTVPPLQEEYNAYDGHNFTSDYHGSHEYKEGEVAYYPYVTGLVQENASHAVIAGNYYPEGVDSVPDTHVPQNPPPRSPRVTTYYKGASNMRQINPSFLSVGGNVYGPLDSRGPSMREYDRSGPLSGGTGNDWRYPTSLNNPTGIFPPGREPPYPIDPRHPSVGRSQNQGRQDRSQGHTQPLRSQTSRAEPNFVHNSTRSYSNSDEDYGNRINYQDLQVTTSGPSTARSKSRSTSIGMEVTVATPSQMQSPDSTQYLTVAKGGPYITPASSISGTSQTFEPAESRSVSVDELGQSSAPELPAPEGKVKIKKHKSSSRSIQGTLSRIFKPRRSKK